MLNKVGKIEEVNHISNLEPTEFYYRCTLTRDGIDGEGLGETKRAALIDAIDFIEMIKLGILYNLESESESPF